jgi:hypothetical protein
MLLFALLQTASARQDPFDDVFPLEVGRSWTCTFSRVFSSTFSHSAVSDTGDAAYLVVGMLDAPDSIRWRVLRRRWYVETTQSYGPPSSTWLQDSVQFEIIERTAGAHELFLDEKDDYGLFPLARSYTVDGQVFRYAPVDSAGETAPTVDFYDSIDPSINRHLTFLMRVNTGIVESRCRGGSISYFFEVRHHLRWTFQAPGTGPFPGYPPPLSITSPGGVPKDTVLYFNNMGVDPLRISDIRSTIGTVTVSPASTEVLPLEYAAFTVKYRPDTAGVAEALLLVTSNASTSPDTLRMTLTASEAAVLEPVPAVYLGSSPFTLRTRETTVTLTNGGDLPLAIDSVRVRARDYAAWVESAVIEPKGKGILHVRCTPTDAQVPSEADIVVYSNSLSSPDTVRVYLIWFGSMVQVLFHSIDFGTVPVGSEARAVVPFIATGDYSVTVTSGPPADPSFSALKPMVFEIPAGTLYNDTVRFRPGGTGLRTSFIVYAWRSTNFLDIFTVLDTVWLTGSGELPIANSLAQNFPNPFNPGTRIDYILARQGFVNLEVFNVLGEKVATLVSEAQDAGSHAAVFNGEKLPSGVYIYRLQSGGFVSAGKMVLLR